MALILTDSQVELREVVLKDKPASMLASSPKGTVPVLVLPDGEVIEESLEIIDWAISQNSTVLSATESAKLATPEPAQLALIKRNDDEFKAALDHYKYFDRFPEHPQSYYRQQGEMFLTVLEQMLSNNSDSPAKGSFLYGDNASYADIAIFPFIRQSSHVDKKWFEQAEYPRLKAWLTNFLSSEDFLMTMTKFPPWQPGDAITQFPAVD